MITVFGSINVDMLFRVPAHPRPGETVTGAEWTSTPGGKGANQALAASRAGAVVRLVGAVGCDVLAESALSELEGGGVDTGAVAHLEGEDTGIAAIIVDANGENAIVVAPGANHAVSAAAAGAIAFTPGDTLMLQLEVPYAEGRKLAQRAADQDARVILSVAPFKPLSATEVAPASILVMNQHEAADFACQFAIAGPTPEAGIVGLANVLGKIVIATLGADGAIAADGKQLIRVPALAMTPVDTTGAGDAFAGVLAARLDAGADLESAMAAAAVAGSLATTKVGAQPRFPLWSEIRSAMAK